MCRSNSSATGHRAAHADEQRPHAVDRVQRRRRPPAAQSDLAECEPRRAPCLAGDDGSRVQAAHASRDGVPQVRPRRRILIGHQSTGDLGMRLARDHGLLPWPLVSTPHAVDLERRARPLALERRVARLAERRWRADLREIPRLVERQGGDRARSLGRVSSRTTS